MMRILAVTAVILSSTTAFAATVPDGAVIKSVLKEKAGVNYFAMVRDDIVDTKNGRDHFSFNDKSVIWSALMKGGLGDIDITKYTAYWYDPSGKIFYKERPISMIGDNLAIKSVLKVEPDRMADRVGLWKIELLCDNQIMDEKYFYLGEAADYNITQESINGLNGKLDRDIEASRDANAAKRIKSDNILRGLISAAIDKTKASKINDMWFVAKDIEPVTDENGLCHISKENAKIYFTVKPVAFLNASSPKIAIYWISPDKRIFKEDRVYSFGESFSSYIKTSDVTDNLLGLWTIAMTIDGLKAAERLFSIEDSQWFAARADKPPDIKRPNKSSMNSANNEELTEDDREYLTKIIKEKSRQINGKYISNAKKKYPKAKKDEIDAGMPEEYVIAALGKPMFMLLRKDMVEIWYYWQINAWDEAQNVSAAVNRDVGAMLFSNPRGTLTKIFIEDGCVIEITKEENVAKTQIR